MKVLASRDMTVIGHKSTDALVQLAIYMYVFKVILNLKMEAALLSELFANF
jgi:hypothetical protein